MSEKNFFEQENLKLRHYISLLSAELELIQRVSEINENFRNSPELNRIIEPILSRISKIQAEKDTLSKELEL
ncbi:hypothetical protein [Nitrosopumilus sp.]|uniref:hypothetical protein n=1 Tax=Nitrosopumilus sp. TaxID=2024843 RepID=UPI002638D39F|nr:hypothetical protein [Nitrosopumilus sp.]